MTMADAFRSSRVKEDSREASLHRPEDWRTRAAKRGWAHSTHGLRMALAYVADDEMRSCGSETTRPGEGYWKPQSVPLVASTRKLLLVATRLQPLRYNQFWSCGKECTRVQDVGEGLNW